MGTIMGGFPQVSITNLGAAPFLFLVDNGGESPDKCRMQNDTEVIEFIEAEAARLGFTPATFCRYAVNDSSLYARLKGGGRASFVTADRLRVFAAEAEPSKRPRK